MKSTHRTRRTEPSVAVSLDATSIGIWTVYIRDRTQACSSTVNVRCDKEYTDVCYALATLNHRTTKCKLQEVMTPWCAGRILVLVDGKEIPPTQVAQDQDHLSTSCSNQKQHGQGHQNYECISCLYATGF